MNKSRFGSFGFGCPVFLFLDFFERYILKTFWLKSEHRPLNKWGDVRLPALRKKNAPLFGLVFPA